MNNVKGDTYKLAYPLTEWNCVICNL